MPRVSIAMAAYNGERHLPAQLGSFVSQTRRPDELVVCDDGSTDGTAALLEAFARTAPFEVKVIRNAANLGYIRNFEKALSLTSGDVVFLSDQDDAWFDHKIERVMERLGGGVHSILNDQIIADGDLKPSGQSKLANIRQAGLPDESMITGCCTAFSAELKALALPFPEDIPAHDIWLGRLAVVLGVRRVLDEPLQLYRRHGENASNWMFSSDRPVGRVALFKAESLAEMGQRRARNLRLLRALRERLSERRDEAVAIAGAEALARAVGDLDRQIAALERQGPIRDLLRPRRLLRLLGVGRR